jgi:RuvB-like protein 2
MGVLFIDEVHMLDVESFSFLNKASEQEFCPILVLASNREECKVRGTNEISRHGIPKDFLDRMLVISTEEYNEEEMRNIIKMRVDEENVTISEDGINGLVEISKECGLRYSLNLLTIAGVRARRRSGTVELTDVERAHLLFLDEKRAINRFREEDGSQTD